MRNKGWYLLTFCFAFLGSMEVQKIMMFDCYGLRKNDAVPAYAMRGVNGTNAITADDNSITTAVLNATCLSVAKSGRRYWKNRYHPNPNTEWRKCLLHTEPSLYINVVSEAVVGFPRFGLYNKGAGEKPSDPGNRKYGNEYPLTGFTMVGEVRLKNFRAAIEEVNRNGIPGAIMEMGVWRGGAMIMAAAVQKEYKMLGQSAGKATIDRDLYLLDAFEEIPASSYGHNSEYLFNTEKQVMDAMDSFGLLDSNVHFMKGLFQETMPQVWNDTSIDKIAVFRVDGNFYDSYQDALYYGYGKVPVGGIVIFDDVMSHTPVMKAWQDFKKDQNLTEDLNRIDLHSAWFRKEKYVNVDMTKMKPPQDINKRTNKTQN